jgi:hypothetical protein
MVVRAATVVRAGSGVAADAGWVTGLRPFTAASTAAVVGAGLVAMAVGSRYRRPGGEPVGGADKVVWASLVGALGAWQLAAYLQHPRSHHPTLSSLTNALLDTHPARAAAFVVWLVAAARLARR